MLHHGFGGMFPSMPEEDGLGAGERVGGNGGGGMSMGLDMNLGMGVRPI
jgi:hypothetical protein